LQLYGHVFRNVENNWVKYVPSTGFSMLNSEADQTEQVYIYIYIYMNDSVKEPNKFHNYETEKITRKASDAAKYIELFGSST